MSGPHINRTTEDISMGLYVATPRNSIIPDNAGSRLLYLGIGFYQGVRASGYAAHLPGLPPRWRHSYIADSLAMWIARTSTQKWCDPFCDSGFEAAVRRA